MQRASLIIGLLAIVACSDSTGRGLTSPNADTLVVQRFASSALEADVAYGIMLKSDALPSDVQAAGATFGPRIATIPDFQLEGGVVQALDAADAAGPTTLDGCSPLNNAKDVRGTIALIQRGTCLFTVKVKNAQNAGAIGVIIYEQSPATLILAPMGGTDPTITIPAIRVTNDVGVLLGNKAFMLAAIFLVAVDAPTLDVPDDIVVASTDGGSVSVTYEVSGSAYGVAVTPGCSQASGSLFPIGTTTVMCTVTDLSLNSVTRSFTVTVELGDTEPPQIAVSHPVVFEATSSAGATVTYSEPTAVDNVGVISVECDRPSGIIYPLGVTTVTCTASDAAGNMAQASFTVTVMDTTAPQLTVPSDIVVDATSPAGATVSYAVSATDLVGVSGSVVCTPTGNSFPIGTTLVTCSAADESGNSSSASFNVTVKGASGQVADLQQAVGGLVLHEGTETSLQTKLSSALDALSANDPAAACRHLTALINQVAAQSGKKISVADAATLIATAQRIRSASGCN